MEKNKRGCPCWGCPLITKWGFVACHDSESHKYANYLYSLWLLKIVAGWKNELKAISGIDFLVVCGLS